jgi:hypothetical protein
VWGKCKWLFKKNSCSEMWEGNLLIFQKLDISGAFYIYWPFKLTSLICQAAFAGSARIFRLLV